MKRRKKPAARASNKDIRVVPVYSDLLNFPSKDDPDFLDKMAAHMAKHHDTIAKLKKIQEDVNKRTARNARRREKRRRERDGTGV